MGLQKFIFNERIIKITGYLLLILSIYPSAGIGGTEYSKQPISTPQVQQAQGNVPVFTIEYVSRRSDEKVVHIIYDKATMTVAQAKALKVKGIEKIKDTENIKVQYPKVVFVGDIKEEDDIRKYYSCSNYHIVYYVENTGSIKFFDKKGKLKKEFVFSKHLIGNPLIPTISISKNREYICVSSCIREHPEVIQEAESVILNTDGDILRKIKHNYKWVRVFPNGKYVIGTDFEYSNDPIGIYGEQGLVFQIKKDSECYDLDFSEDGSFWAITFERKIKGPRERFAENFRADLIVFDDKLKELWRKEGIVKGSGSACEVKILKDNTIVLMAGVDNYKIFYFDIKGNLIREEQGNPQMLREFKEKVE